MSALIGGAGFFAGFYLVPLQTLLQRLTPPGEQGGSFLGTANALSFIFSSIAALLVPLMLGEHLMHPLSQQEARLR